MKLIFDIEDALRQQASQILNLILVQKESASVQTFYFFCLFQLHTSNGAL